MMGKVVSALTSGWNSYSAVLLLSLFIIIVTVACWSWSVKKRSHPAGPFAWPLVGHLPNLLREKSRLAFFTAIADKYGPVTTVWLGCVPIVTLNTPEAIKEAFITNSDSFDSRPFPPLAQEVFDGKRAGVLLLNGEPHVLMRRLTIAAMHEFALAKQSQEEKIRNEVIALSDQLQKAGSTPIRDVRKTIRLAVSNIMLSICTGNRLPYDNPELSNLIDQFDAFFRSNILFQPENAFPLLGRLRKNKAVSQIVSAQESFRKHLCNQIESHRATFNRDNIRDMTDLYLKACEEKRDYFNSDNLFRIIIDLFVAGSETTTSTIAWALLFMITDQRIQRNAREEVFKVLGKHGNPTAKDRPRLVYIDAFVHEVLRYASIVPLGIPRFLEKDARVCGVEIPKGCYVFPNLLHIHMDQGYWKDPDVFRPERWIGNNGSITKHDYYLPFSIGKRACIGENFTKTEVFIVLTMLLQRFQFSLPEGASKPSLEGQAGLTRIPSSYELCATPL